jgi:hypothetical protein
MAELSVGVIVLASGHITSLVVVMKLVVVGAAVVELGTVAVVGTAVAVVVVP